MLGLPPSNLVWFVGVTPGVVATAVQVVPFCPVTDRLPRNPKTLYSVKNEPTEDVCLPSGPAVVNGLVSCSAPVVRETK